MKQKFNIQTTLVLAIVLSVLAGLGSCNKGDDPSPKQAQINRLSTTWKVDRVTNDGQNVTSQYTGFTLTIDELSYTTQNGGNPWPASGSYDFDGNDLNTLVRTDRVEITIDEITKNTLILSFNFDALEGARLNGITGEFTFSLIK